MAKILEILLLAIFAIKFISSSENIQFAESNKKFALNFFNELLKDSDNKGKNLVYSPYSIQAAGALLFAGADGETATEMIKGLNLPSSEVKTVGEIFKNEFDHHLNQPLFKMANKLFVAQSYSVAPNFYEIATNIFNSDIENVDFEKSSESANIINKWIEEKTDGKIHDLIKSDSLGSDTKLLIGNAIYFKGNWQKKFNKKYTDSKPFFTTPEEQIHLDTMSDHGDYKVGNFKQFGVRAIELPFKDSNISMFILVPGNQMKSLTEIENNLSNLIFDFDIFNKLQENFIYLTIPKFKFEHEIDVKEIWQNLGIVSLFSSQANLKNLLNPPQPLYVSKALHKASIEVNEEGAEAAAVTIIESSNKSQREPDMFLINQSFLYFIKGENGEIYFMGRFTGK